jgi:hypothetical protein
MNTMVMNKAQCPAAADAPAERAHGRSVRRMAAHMPKAQWRQLGRRLSVAVTVAAALGVLVALIAVTPRAVQALSVPPVTASVELPRVVIRAERLPAGACPVPTERGAACPVPLLSSSRD